MIFHEVHVNSLVIGENKPLTLIAGPCALEAGDINFNTAAAIKKYCEELKISFIFKASFDKANRTSLHSYRGPGIVEGLELLKEIKDKLQVPVLTDIHEVHQIQLVAEVVDVIQIPAFLCRQTDLLVEAGKTGRAVNIKKGQFLSPENMETVVEKIVSTGNEKILLTERGTFFGYGDLVVDFRAIPKMKKFGYPVIFDAGHSLQRPGAAGTHTGGERQYIPTLAKAAVAAGCNGVFIEVHPEPAKSPSDSETIWQLDKLYPLLLELKKMYECRLDIKI